MTKQNELLDKTGYISISELEELVLEPDYAGGAWTTIPCLGVIGGIIGGTLGFDACPTSACSKSCNN